MLEAHPIITASSILGATLGLDCISRWLLSRVVKRGSNWFRAILLGALKGPLTLILWVVGLACSLEYLPLQVDEKLMELLPNIWRIGLIAGLAWFACRLTRRVEVQAVEEKKADPTTSGAISKVLRASTVIIATLMIVQRMGFSLSGVLAFGGIGGIAVGFAAKDTLANFFGAFMLYWDQPFKVGDWVKSSDKEIEGYVEHIGWRLTRIRSFEKRPIYVPNSIFSTITLTNVTRMTHRRIKESIGIRYDDIDQVNAITREIKEMILSHPGIDGKQFTVVNFEEFGPSSLNILVYCFTRTKKWAEYLDVKQEILLKISEIIGEHGAEIAYPTQRLQIDKAEAFV